MNSWDNLGILLRMPTKGFPGGSDGKESTAVKETRVPSGRFPEDGYPLQYSSLENSMDRGAWQAAVHGVTKSWTQPRD